MRRMHACGGGKRSRGLGGSIIRMDPITSSGPKGKKALVKAYANLVERGRRRPSSLGETLSLVAQLERKKNVFQGSKKEKERSSRSNGRTSGARKNR